MGSEGEAQQIQHFGGSSESGLAGVELGEWCLVVGFEGRLEGGSVGEGGEGVWRKRVWESSTEVVE